MPGLTWWADRPPTGGYEPGPDTPNDRIDLISAAGPSVTLDSRIVGEAGARDVSIGVDPWPSDHRAVVSTFRVRLAPAPDVVGAGQALAIGAGGQVLGPSGEVRLRTSKPVYRAGEPIDVDWAGGPGNRWDWIAIFRAPAAELRDAHLIWRHTGTRIDGSVRLDPDAALVDQSSIGGSWPLPPGEYVAAYLLDDASVAAARVPFSIVS